LQTAAKPLSPSLRCFRSRDELLGTFVPPMNGRVRQAAFIAALCAAVSGCAKYQPLPLPDHARLAPMLAELRRDVPAGVVGTAPQKLDIDRPLDLDSIGLLAILNDPELRSERGTIGVAQGALLQASTLPNPSMNLAYGALLGGPGTAPSFAASLSQDIAAIVTYRARVESARAHVQEVNADQLWQEWQVAQKARLLALDLYWGERSTQFQQRELDLVSGALTKVQAATAAGNLDLTAVSPLATAEAAAEQALTTLDLDQLKNWQALDGLLGLAPEVRFEIAKPELPPPPAADDLLRDLAQRRPDLVALRLGYRAADEDVRAAILGQFPAFTLGGSWNSDTTGVRSAGPTVTFDLPIFNRNQGQVASSQATRLLLHEQYQARLDSAVGDIRALAAQTGKFAAALARARQAAATAESLATRAQSAYTQGNLDQRAWTDYQTSASQRQLETVALERSLGEAEIALTVELGLGLPTARLAPSEAASSP
jgi:outer membrane protein TolC